MAVHLSNPELQNKVDQWVTETGRPVDELIEDAIAGYFDELATLRKTLDSRYDEMKAGHVNVVSADQLRDRLRSRKAVRSSVP